MIRKGKEKRVRRKIAREGEFERKEEGNSNREKGIERMKTAQGE